MINDVFPFRCGIERTMQILHTLVIAEIIHQCLRYIRRRGARTAGAIIHADRCTTILHQFCHRLCLHINGRFLASVCLLHVRPVKSSHRTFCHTDPFCVGINLLHGRNRKALFLIVIIKNLSHCRGNTSRFAIRFRHFWTQKIVGFTLSPLRLNQRSNRSLHAGRSLAQSLSLCSRRLAIFLQISNLVCIALQPRLHVFRHVLCIEGTLIRVADDVGREV